MDKNNTQSLSHREVEMNDKIVDMLEALSIYSEVVPMQCKAIREKYLSLIAAGFTETQALELSKTL